MDIGFLFDGLFCGFAEKCKIPVVTASDGTRKIQGATFYIELEKLETTKEPSKSYAYFLELEKKEFRRLRYMDKVCCILVSEEPPILTYTFKEQYRVGVENMLSRADVQLSKDLLARLRETPVSERTERETITGIKVWHDMTTLTVPTSPLEEVYKLILMHLMD